MLQQQLRSVHIIKFTDGLSHSYWQQEASEQLDIQKVGGNFQELRWMLNLLEFSQYEKKEDPLSGANSGWWHVYRVETGQRSPDLHYVIFT